jgi:hypothetical protein
LEAKPRRLSLKTVEFYSERFQRLGKNIGRREVLEVTVHDLRSVPAESTPGKRSSKLQG